MRRADLSIMIAAQMAERHGRSCFRLMRRERSSGSSDRRRSRRSVHGCTMGTFCLHRQTASPERQKSLALRRRQRTRVRSLRQNRKTYRKQIREVWRVAYRSLQKAEKIRAAVFPSSEWVHYCLQLSFLPVPFLWDAGKNVWQSAQALCWDVFFC